ncbi:MAG: peptidylprolyl isomerase [Verrucomicrobia bacterium]|nr:peptidylprolyl isomerase [Verrucomicrobiota bacterium]
MPILAPGFLTRPRLLAAVVLVLACNGSDARAAGAAGPASGGTPEPLFDDPVVARGQGFEVRRSQVDQAFVALKANLAVRRQTIPEGLRQLREAQLLDSLILNKLMNLRASEEDRKRGREIAQQLTAEVRKEFSSQEAFERRLKALGLSPSGFYRRLEEQALADAVIDRQLKSTIVIPDAQVREFYDTGTDVRVRMMQEAVERMARTPDTPLNQLTAASEQIEKVRTTNLEGLEEPERVRVQHIFALTKDRDTDLDLPEAQIRAKRQKMDRLLARARSGEDFARLVLEHSEDRALSTTKGEYTFTRQDAFVPEFKAAAFSMRTNQISDVVVTPFGLHIIKLLERIPARKVAFDKAAPGIRDYLARQEAQRILPEFFARVKKDAAVEILDPKYILDAPGSSGSRAPP